MNRLLPASMLLLTLLTPVARADDDDHPRRAQPTPAWATPEARRYREECGSCHFAFPANLLPARSWTKLLTELGDHFKQNAEVHPATRALLERYLTEHAADSQPGRKASKLLSSIEGTTPLRVSTLPWMVREHAEIPPAVYARPQISSRANCPACHADAEQGSFDEDRARIPR